MGNQTAYNNVRTIMIHVFTPKIIVLRLLYLNSIIYSNYFSTILVYSLTCTLHLQNVSETGDKCKHGNLRY